MSNDVPFLVIMVSLVHEPNVSSKSIKKPSHETEFLVDFLAPSNNISTFQKELSK